ncbi:MAG: ankyrin repeat domain-containing protein [Opitutae bacterium]|nr:ankyrin repeat domain-containing protein [Opitutae bacterium]
MGQAEPGHSAPKVERPNVFAGMPAGGDGLWTRGGNPAKFQKIRNPSMENGGKMLVALSCMLLPFVTGCLGLHKAVGEGDLAKAGQFLQKGVDVDARDTYGRTPLMWATDDLGVVHYLVDKGADVNSKDINGETPLMKAAFLGRLDVVRYLVRKGADVNAKSERGGTPLMWASGDLAVAKYLVGKGVDVNAKDNNGETALKWATNFGRLDVAQYLAGKGADANAGNGGNQALLLHGGEPGHRSVNWLEAKAATE